MQIERKNTMNINLNEKELNILSKITEEILDSTDYDNIREIYMPTYCIKKDKLIHVVNIFVVVKDGFQNLDLYDVINGIEERKYPFELSVSVEPEFEKGKGITLYKNS